MYNFYLIYGEDRSIINNEIDKIKKDLNISSLIKYSLDKDSLEDILLDASLVNLFDPKKYILVEDANIFSSKKDEDSIKLEEYFNNYNSDTYIIFSCVSEKIDSRKKIVKKINEIGRVIETKKKDSNYVNSYVNDYLKDNGYILEDRDYFLSKVGSNIDNIKNELDKLFIYKGDTKKISNSDIDKLIIPNFEDEIFILTDAVIKNNVERSLELLEEFLNKSYDEMQIIIMLANQFRFMLQVKILSNKNMNYESISKKLGANPYRVKITIKNCYYYDIDSLLLYLKKLALLDEDIKYGRIDKKIGLQLFLMNKDNK